MTSVYVITCPSINDKKYVGLTKLPIEKRLMGHISSAHAGSKFALHEAIRKYGSDKFRISQLVCCSSREQAAEQEIKFISELSSHVDTGLGYNMTLGGEGIVGLSEGSLMRMGPFIGKNWLPRSSPIQSNGIS